MMPTAQTDFFNLIGEEHITVTVIKIDGRFVATISGGWWMASGKTEGDAVRKVVKNYETEMAYMEGATA